MAKDETIQALSRDVEGLQHMLHSEMAALRKTTKAEVRQMQVRRAPVVSQGTLRSTTACK